jgi:hypothetical protein
MSELQRQMQEARLRAQLEEEGIFFAVMFCNLLSRYLQISLVD